MLTATLPLSGRGEFIPTLEEEAVNIVDFLSELDANENRSY